MAISSAKHSWDSCDIDVPLTAWGALIALIVATIAFAIYKGRKPGWKRPEMPAHE